MHKILRVISIFFDNDRLFSFILVDGVTYIFDFILPCYVDLAHIFHSDVQSNMSLFGDGMINKRVSRTNGNMKTIRSVFFTEPLYTQVDIVKPGHTFEVTFIQPQIMFKTCIMSDTV